MRNCVPGQQGEIAAPLAAGKEDLLAVVPPLRDVVRRAGHCHASDARRSPQDAIARSDVKTEAVPLSQSFHRDEG